MSASHVAKAENVRVLVEVDFGRYIRQADPEAQKRIAQGVVEQIKRHVDDIDSVSVVWDLRYFCEFCGYEITDEPGRAGDSAAIVCCDEQIGAWHERHAQEISEELFPGTLAALEELTRSRVAS